MRTSESWSDLRDELVDRIGAGARNALLILYLVLIALVGLGGILALERFSIDESLSSLGPRVTYSAAFLSLMIADIALDVPSASQEQKASRTQLILGVILAILAITLIVIPLFGFPTSLSNVGIVALYILWFMVNSRSERFVASPPVDAPLGGDIEHRRLAGKGIG